MCPVMMFVVGVRLGQLCDEYSVARCPYMGNRRYGVCFSVFVKVAIIGALRNSRERLARLDKVCDYGPVGPHAAAAWTLCVALHFAFAALAASLVALERHNRRLGVRMRVRNRRCCVLGHGCSVECRGR